MYTGKLVDRLHDEVKIEYGTLCALTGLCGVLADVVLGATEGRPISDEDILYAKSALTQLLIAQNEKKIVKFDDIMACAESAMIAYDNSEKEKDNGKY